MNTNPNPHAGRDVIIAVLVVLLLCGCCLGTIGFVASNASTGFVSTLIGGIIGRTTAPQAIVEERLDTGPGVQTYPGNGGNATIQGNVLLQSGYFTANNVTYVNLVFSEYCPATTASPTANWHFESAPYYGTTVSASHITSGNLLDDRYVEWKALGIPQAPSCNYRLHP